METIETFTTREQRSNIRNKISYKYNKINNKRHMTIAFLSTRERKTWTCKAFRQDQGGGEETNDCGNHIFGAKNWSTRSDQGDLELAI